MGVGPGVGADATPGAANGLNGQRNRCLQRVDGVEFAPTKNPLGEAERSTVVENQAGV